MLSYPPSEHTKLMNLCVLLGRKNIFIKPTLYDRGYPLRELGLRIPIPSFDPDAVPPPAPTPDAGYSSTQKNAVIFLEAKGGGSDEDQVEKFYYIQQHPETLVATSNKLQINEINLIIDFGIICSNIEKISEDNKRNPLPFPVLYYDEKQKLLSSSNLIKASFLNPDIIEAFSDPISIPRLPLVNIPFSSYDYPENAAYFIQKIMIMVLSKSGKLGKYERFPPLEEIVTQEYPLFNLLGKREFHELIVTVERILYRLFPDDNPDSSFDINKYREVKKGKIFLRRRSLKKFLGILESSAIEYQKYRRGTMQTKLSRWDNSKLDSQRDLYDQIDQFFDPTLFFTKNYDADDE